MLTNFNLISQKDSKTLLCTRIDQTKAFEIELETEIVCFYTFTSSQSSFMAIVTKENELNLLKEAQNGTFEELAKTKNLNLQDAKEFLMTHYFGQGEKEAKYLSLVLTDRKMQKLI